MVDDDEVIDIESLQRGLGQGQEFVVQEKVDGANVSLHFQEEWNPIIQKRSGIIEMGEKHPQYDVFRFAVLQSCSCLCVE